MTMQQHFSFSHTVFNSTTQSQLLMTLRNEAFENNLGKGETAGNQHFLLFQNCFQSSKKQNSVFKSHLFCRLQKLSIRTSLKFCRLEKSLKTFFSGSLILEFCCIFVVKGLGICVILTQGTRFFMGVSKNNLMCMSENYKTDEQL